MSSQGRLGDQAFCAADGHGCPACPHPVVGPATSGSGDVWVNGLSALRDGDPGIHAACCGPNQWSAAGGGSECLHQREKSLSDGRSHLSLWGLGLSHPGKRQRITEGQHFQAMLRQDTEGYAGSSSASE